MGHAGNQKLLQLVFACRGRLGQAVETLLTESFANDVSQRNVDPMILGGVYFTATGEKPTEQGFTRTLLDRMMEQQEWLAWTTGRLRSERRLSIAAWILKMACLVLTLAALVQLAWFLSMGTGVK
jgi:hypothetical protein